MLQRKLQELMIISKKLESLLSEKEKIENIQNLEKILNDFFINYLHIKNVVYFLIQNKFSKIPIEYLSIENRLLEGFQNLDSFYQNLITIINNIKEIEKYSSLNKTNLLKLYLENLNNQRYMLAYIIQSLSLLIFDIIELLKKFEQDNHYESNA